jgi:hypothetical protein
LEALDGTGVQRLHVDLMDGVFCPMTTFGRLLVNALPGRPLIIAAQHPDANVQDRRIATVALSGHDERGTESSLCRLTTPPEPTPVTRTRRRSIHDLPSDAQRGLQPPGVDDAPARRSRRGHVCAPKERHGAWKVFQLN